MNIQELDILNVLLETPCSNQRMLAEVSGHSLGIVNRCVRSLTTGGYLNELMQPTEKARREAAALSPKSAVILAAGFGLRMIPVNRETPKGLLEVKGEPLIERLICQLRAAGVQQIYIVVGFMKEQYEYLIDKYRVRLIVNPLYAERNNLHSLQCALRQLSNTYILPCDVWCANNPFRRHEMYSWYMVSDRPDRDSSVRINRKKELTTVPSGAEGNAMVGICYLCGDAAKAVAGRVAQLCQDPRYDNAFWEEALYGPKGMSIPGRVVPSAEVIEINTYEQLRELDNDSNSLKSGAISAICRILDVPAQEIQDISVLKKGMTNRSFLFSCRGKRYIMRIPGEGTDRLINRRQEADVYTAIADEGLCDNILYISPENGYKITEYIENARVCDPDNTEDLRRCMAALRAFHKKGLVVAHEFNLFRQIDYYETLRGGPSAYKDYAQTKEQVWALRPYIDAHAAPHVLTHIDAVPDNFLFAPSVSGEEDLYLIDWEYAGMQDPHVDIAMFCIYALYDRAQTDRLIGLYFPEGCPRETVLKIYCYIACCGLLWSNWCEYKRSLGMDFGAYSLAQYRYAKDYARIVRKELEGGDKSYV